MTQVADSTSCDLSVVITVVSGAVHLAECLAAFERQADCGQVSMEIIVPYDREQTDIPSLQERFPGTVFHPISLTVDGPAGLCHEHFDELRTAGLQLARGQIIAMLEDHEQADAHWCRRMIETHQLPHAAVGGAVENGVDSPLNWATWFLDFGRYQNPLKEGPSTFLTDVNIAYKKQALDAVRPAWENGFSEPAVHSALLARGETLWLSPGIIVYQHRTGLTLSHAMYERYVWGRFFAGNRFHDKELGRRLVYSAASVAVPGIILLKKVRDVLDKGRLQGKFVKALPMIVLLAICWASGECIGYLTGKPSSYHH